MTGTVVVQKLLFYAYFQIIEKLTVTVRVLLKQIDV